jgi:hypothetical protein
LNPSSSADTNAAIRAPGRGAGGGRGEEEEAFSPPPGDPVFREVSERFDSSAAAAAAAWFA